MSLQIKKYVLGFAFHRDCVALIFKTKGPPYVIGTWNGIGGKIEAQDDSVVEAMAREFCEETGLFIGYDMWHHFATQRGISDDGNSYELHSFVAHLPNDQDFSAIHNTEGDGETVAWMDYSDDGFDALITPNLKWLIPLALDNTTSFLDIVEL